MESDVRPKETSHSADQLMAGSLLHTTETESSDAPYTSAVGVAAVGVAAVGIAGIGVKTSRLSKSDRKIGHWRVDDEGQVTYKKKPTSELMKAIQLGLGHSIGSFTPKPVRDLLYEDFNVVETVSFPREGSHVTAAHDCSDFRFKTFAPTAFRYFREVFKIQPDDFLYSLCNNALKELSNPGASGSIFYITYDDEFIIKTVQRKEAEFLQKLLPGYYMNVNQNPCTLLPKFYGLFCYQCGGKNIRFVIMNNVLPSSVHLHEKFDLKGSTYKRQASRHERRKEKPTLKDLDFLQLHPSGLAVPAETYPALLRTIERDCRVLQSFKIMDYSLLLGVHRLKTESTSRRTSSLNEIGDNCQQSESLDSQRVLRPKTRLAKYTTAMEAIQATTGDQIDAIPAYDPDTQECLQLYVGIIDVLQSYRFSKKFEHTVKSLVQDANTISVHQPGFYARRFQKFVTGSVFKKHIPQNVQQSPSKRHTMFGASVMVAGPTAVRKKSSAVLVTAESADIRPPSMLADRPMTVGSERKPDLLPQPTPPPSHSVSLVDVQVHSPMTFMSSSYREHVLPVHSHHPLSASVHSVSSSQSHMDHTDAAVSYTDSSPSVCSLANVDVIDAEKASAVKHDADGDDDDTVRQVVSATHSPSVTAATAADDDSDDDDGAGGAIVETTRL